MPRGRRDLATNDNKTVAAKLDPGSNKVVKRRAKAALRKPKITTYDNVLDGKFENPPKPRARSTSHHPTKATYRMSNKAAHYRKLNGSDLSHKSREAASRVDLLEYLPKHVRRKIWRLLVVEDGKFIWPFAEKMQPDIARTCRTYRKETLPMYYRENVFAWDLEYHRPPSGSGVSPVVAFAHAMQEGGWLKYVKNWAFTMDVKEKHGEDDGETKIVWNPILYSIKMPMVSKKAEQGSPIIEIHHSSLCVLSKADPRCVLAISPTELYENVIRAMFEDDGDGFMTAKVLHNLTAYLAGSAQHHLGSRCDREEHPRVDIKAIVHFDASQVKQEGEWPGLQGEEKVDDEKNDMLSSILSG